MAGESVTPNNGKISIAKETPNTRNNPPYNRPPNFRKVVVLALRAANVKPAKIAAVPAVAKTTGPSRDDIATAGAIDKPIDKPVINNRFCLKVIFSGLVNAIPNTPANVPIKPIGERAKSGGAIRGAIIPPAAAPVVARSVL